MDRRTVAALACILLMALGTAGCAGPKQVSFPAGTTMDRLHQAGKITVGVKFDQPGLGFRNLATRRPEGFDIRMAEIVAAALGLTPNQIEYVETVTPDREGNLRTGRVDIVVASYSITDAHRQEVGQAGPYYVTGQQLLVREADKNTINDPDRLAGVRICSVTGSTSVARVRERYGSQIVEFRTYTECVRSLLAKAVDAVTSDGAVLLGYAAQQPDKLEVVGRPFSDERYGIGYRKGDQAFCRFLTDTITAAEANGDWKKAFQATLGGAGVPVPTMPTPDPCQA
jgi:glutamate transport system substrate-binding protein